MNVGDRVSSLIDMSLDWGRGIQPEGSVGMVVGHQAERVIVAWSNGEYSTTLPGTLRILTNGVRVVASGGPPSTGARSSSR